LLPARWLRRRRQANTWSTGWALHVLTVTTWSEGRLTDALSLFDRALAVTESDPALADLGLLIRINKAVGLGDLDRHEEGLAVARQARDLADRVGTVNRLGQAHSALAQVLFLTGSWDDALAEVQVIHPGLLEPGAACIDLGTAAVIRFHRGEAGAARRHLAAATRYAEQLGHRLISFMALARSLDREYDNALPEAFAELAVVLDADREELNEIEALLPDAARLAAQIGDPNAAQAIARRAAFRGAAELYDALGAAADVARLEHAFRAHGIRRGPRAKHRKARSGWESLTPTEIKIVAYVEEGLSNPQIAAELVVSPRTVATHVSSILKKLGLQSRIDIARESVVHATAPR
jgi:DNA-binding NarL/FixJ family response regulator